MPEEEMYFVIYNSDGDTTVTPYTKDEIRKYLKDKIEDEENTSSGDFIKLDDLLSCEDGEGVANDTNYWGERQELIIKGIVVVPKPVKVVKKLEIE